VSADNGLARSPVTRARSSSRRPPGDGREHIAAPAPASGRWDRGAAGLTSNGAFVWEIGHTSNFANPPGDFCLPGQTQCDSYDEAHWLGFTPLRIKSVTFAGGSHAHRWAVVSDFGGTAEINQNCPAYGGPYCVYPWFAFNVFSGALTYGADYPGTLFNYGQANQFATTPQCGGRSARTPLTATRSSSPSHS
jgi:hypothetical protein